MKKILPLFLSIIFILSFSSCRKEKETTATVYVVNSAQEPVAGISVRVYCPNSTCGNGILNEGMNRVDVTNSSGKVKFNYTEDYKLGQAGFAVLDVEVTQSGSTSPDATGVIKIEEEKDNEQTIVCQTCP